MLPQHVHWQECNAGKRFCTFSTKWPRIGDWALSCHSILWNKYRPPWLVCTNRDSLMDHDIWNSLCLFPSLLPICSMPCADSHVWGLKLTALCSMQPSVLVSATGTWHFTSSDSRCIRVLLLRSPRMYVCRSPGRFFVLNISVRTLAAQILPVLWGEMWLQQIQTSEISSLT